MMCWANTDIAGRGAPPFMTSRRSSGAGMSHRQHVTVFTLTGGKFLFPASTEARSAGQPRKSSGSSKWYVFGRAADKQTGAVSPQPVDRGHGMCWRCDMYDAIARREYDPDKRERLRMGEDMISRYMAEHGVGFPEAVEALGEERRAEFADLRATYAARHGLDDDETMFALWRHGIDGPARMQ